MFLFTDPRIWHPRLPQYAETFVKNDVNMDLLKILSDAELQDEINVPSSIHRKRIIAAARRINDGYDPYAKE